MEKREGENGDEQRQGEGGADCGHVDAREMETVSARLEFDGIGGKVRPLMELTENEERPEKELTFSGQEEI